MANSITLFSNQSLSMTSREIAELVESRHDNVKISIERLAERGVITLPALQDVSNKVGQSIKEYLFRGEKGKRDSIIVVAQLCPEFTARLVDRWQELEAKVPALTPLELMLKQAEQMVLQERAVKALALRQEHTEARLVETEDQLKRIDTATTDFTVLGYFRMFIKESLTLKVAARIGVKATAYCKKNGIKCGEVPDPRFGKANTYPKEVLDLIVGELTL